MYYYPSIGLAAGYEGETTGTSYAGKWVLVDDDVEPSEPSTMTDERWARYHGFATVEMWRRAVAQ